MTKHELRDVVCFSVKGVREGSFRREVQLAQPYWRWYCSCGAVGRKESSEQTAHQGFAHHTEEEF